MNRYNTLSDKFGDEYEHWNGVDVSLNGRLQNGLRFQAGTSTGHTVADNCAVIAKVPEMLTNGPANAGGTAAAGPQLAQQFCHLAEPWLTNFKALVFYTLPKVDVQLAVTFRSVPGLTNTGGNGSGGVQPSGLQANFVATNAYLAANSNLGRLLTGTTTATQNTPLQIINPDTVYLDRDNQVDFRVGKVFRWKGTEIDGQPRSLQYVQCQHGPDGESGVHADQQRLAGAHVDYQSAAGEDQSDAGSSVAMNWRLEVGGRVRKRTLSLTSSLHPLTSTPSPASYRASSAFVMAPRSSATQASRHSGRTRESAVLADRRTC